MKTLFYKFLILFTLILIIALITSNIKEYFQSDDQLRYNCINSVPIPLLKCVKNVKSNMTTINYNQLANKLLYPKYNANIVLNLNSNY